MRKLLETVLGVVSATAASAAQMPPVVAPPAGVPAYRGIVFEHVEPLDQIRQHCKNSRAEACAYAIRTFCIVYLHNSTSPQRLAALRAHEYAHCAGWPKDHQGGVPVAVY